MQGYTKAAIFKDARRTKGISPLSIPPMFYSTSNRPQPHRYIYVGCPDNLKQRTDVSPDRDYVARVGFSGRGSVGVLSRKGEKRSEFTPNLERLIEPSYVEYVYTTQDNTSLTTRISLLEVASPSYLVKSFNPSQTIEYLSNFKIRQAYRRKLEVEERAENNRRVARGLTTRGRNVISDGCALLEYKYGVRQLGFYTLTCPYADSSDIQVFNDNYPEILRRYFQELRRIYERRKLCFSYVGVYEVQPGRFERTGDECLHFHYVARATDATGRFVLQHTEIRNLYARIVAEVCGKESNNPPRVDSQLLRKSASGYLAKYFSKGKPDDVARVRDGAYAALSSWYSVARNLLTAIRRAIVELPRHIADDLFRASKHEFLPVWVRYLRPVYRDIDGGKFHVGCVFQLTGDFLSHLRGIVFPEVEHLV